MTPHRIELRGFWVSTPAPDGLTRHARAFGQPRLSTPGETVWLTGPTGPAAVAVNGSPVGDAPDPGQPWAFDVTALLRPRNEVAIVSASPDPPTGVAVEIRPGA